MIQSAPVVNPPLFEDEEVDEKNHWASIECFESFAKITQFKFNKNIVCGLILLIFQIANGQSFEWKE